MGKNVLKFSLLGSVVIYHLSLNTNPSNMPCLTLKKQKQSGVHFIPCPKPHKSSVVEPGLKPRDNSETLCSAASSSWQHTIKISVFYRVMFCKSSIYYSVSILSSKPKSLTKWIKKPNLKNNLIKRVLFIRVSCKESFEQWLTSKHLPFSD